MGISKKKLIRLLRELEIYVKRNKRILLCKTIKMLTEKLKK